MNIKSKFLAAGAAISSGFMSAAAFAQSTTPLADAVTGELTSGKVEILAVGAAVLTLVGVVTLIRHVRASAR